MQLVLPPLRRLLARKRISNDHPVLLHSDQGSQYSSAGYHSLLKSHNVTQSMSRAGTPHDNAVMESILGWFKEFLRAEYLCRSSEPIRPLLDKAVFEFNHFRPSFKLHYKSPIQFKTEQGFCWISLFLCGFFCLLSLDLCSSLVVLIVQWQYQFLTLVCIMI